MQLSKDGVPVLLHDKTLKRTTNAREVYPDRGPWKVRDFTLAELKRLDAGAWFAPEFAGERVPTLAEALATFRAHKLGVWLELKNPRLNPGLERTVAATLARTPGGWLTSPDRAQTFAAATFDLDALARFTAEIDHAVPVGGIVSKVPSDATLRRLAHWMDYLVPDHESRQPGDIERIHEAGMRAAYWTVDDPDALRALAVSDADVLVSNRPAVAAGIRDREPVSNSETGPCIFGCRSPQ